jgi:protein SCO1/2
MIRKYTMHLFVVAIVLIPVVVFAIVQWTEQRFQTLPVIGEKGHLVSGFNAADQGGKSRGINDWSGKIVVANFFFTHCPVICPKMVYQLKRVQAYSEVDNLMIASFTVDPERDTVARLSAYAQKFEIAGNWSLLTGDKKEIYRLARKSFLLVATDGDGGPDDFIHSERLVLVDQEKRIRGFYNGTDENEVNKLVKDIKKLAEEQD